MKRAAEEFIRTRNVWRRHLQMHRGTVACVCEYQVGRFRKGQRIGGCGNSRCWLCHSEKVGSVPTIQQLKSVATFKEGLAEMSSLSNNTFERTVRHRGPRLAAARSSWPAAQLGR
jgi:hypothetical protein